ncbi:uncharacterized protein LOC111631461 [Centruroides sculpturatus]|uniref:uncharacterized protein LOC111631461 n=1 Tax=Centruroides sculpturatus TaxID=218467 RepID=UPI000C6E6BF5|nr:uncharacterized protein LOC111631461 [Centruroides sculpturatus]
MSIQRISLPVGCESLLPKLRILCLRKAIRTTRKAVFSKLNCIIKVENQIHNQDPGSLQEINRKIVTFQRKLERSLSLRYQKKFDWILNKQKPQEAIQLPSMICWDNISPPDFLVRSLSQGPMFAPRDSYIRTEKVMPDLENLITGMSEVHKEYYRWKSAFKIQQANNRIQDERNWKQIHKSKKWLADNNIVVLKADKSKALVLLQRNTYVSMMQKYINDTECEPIEDGFVNKLQARVKKFTQTPFARELGISRAVVPSPDTPRLFAFAKTHKDKPALRPILDKARSPTRMLDTAIHKHIAHSLNNYPWSVRNSAELLEALRPLSINDRTYITVLDFVSLYPSIKIQPCFCAIRDLLLKSHGAYRKQILELAHLLCYNSFFRFNNKTYLQKRGVPMGSPISGDLCELVVRQLEQKIIPMYSSNILIYKRYVDDIFIMWKAKPDINNFIDAMNNNPYGLCIKLDQISNSNATFLDINIQLGGNMISTRVHYKPCYTPRFIPASSDDPFSYKVAAFRALTKRAFTHHSNFEDTLAELQHIQNIATQHGYGKRLIQNLALAYSSRVYNDSSRTNNSNNLQCVAVVEYNRHLDPIYREIAKRINKRIAYKRRNTIYNILRNSKDNIDERYAPGVYSVPLRDHRFQRDLIYIGSTIRSLDKRMREHKYDIEHNRCTTALSTYASTPGISANLQNAQIIKMSHRREHVRTLEALEIYKAGLRNSCINYKDAINISAAWRFAYEAECPHNSM